MYIFVTFKIQQLAQNSFEHNSTQNGGTGEGGETVVGTSVQAKYLYVAQQPDELSFSKGDLITVIEKSNDGWWKGE